MSFAPLIINFESLLLDNNSKFSEFHIKIESNNIYIYNTKIIYGIKPMELLPLDIKRLIVNILPMPDKRNFIRCTTELNRIKINQYENDFIKMVQDTYYLVYDNNLKWIRITKIEQYTLEMIYYGYEKLIPERYFCNKNELLYKYGKLHRIIGRNGYFRIVKKILIGMNKNIYTNYLKELH